MKKCFLSSLKVFLLMTFFVTLIGCGSDDDDDDNDSTGKTDAQEFCDRAAQCELGSEIGVASTQECLDYFSGLDSETAKCALEAADCADLKDCLGLTGDDTVSDDDTVEPPDTFTCEGAGLPVRDFTDAQSDSMLYAIAADITVPTTSGDWNFKTEWTGCETYLFIQDSPRQASGWDVPLWDRDVSQLLESLPVNTQVFFVSNLGNDEDRTAALAAIELQVKDYTDDLSSDEQNRWWHRIHYITDVSTSLESWLGQLMVSPRWGVGIDRFQRIRYIGSYADPQRYDSGEQWFAPNLSMAANEAVYYNFEADREQRLEDEDATLITVFDNVQISDPGWAGTRTSTDVVLPDAATMAGFDSMEFDIFVDCVGDGEYGTCPAWDYINSLYLCDAGNPDVCDIEIGRWITTYHREGRWVHDVSALLPLLGDGGTRRFAFYTQQLYAITLQIRLFNAGKDARPVEADYLFSGGTFDLNYNVGRDPVVVNIPADAEKVELAIVISGHGMASPGNCAEFCDTTHTFTVNGTDNVVDFPQAGTTFGCMEMTDQGTVPNQYGTWWYGRSGWCPGKEVPVTVIDVTDQITLDADNTFEYAGLYEGAPYTGSGANIDLTSWVVISK